MSLGAVRSIARHEARRQWPVLLAIGLVAGLIGGALTAAAALAVRTASAPERLLATTAVGDADVRLFGDTSLAAAITALPMVADATTTSVGVGRVEERGAVQFVGITAPVEAERRMFRPVVVDGRSPDPTRVDEVLVSQDVADTDGFAVGDRLVVAMLTPGEVQQFDTGFGDPDGPTVALTITGIARMPPGVLDGTPVIATPAFGAAHAALATGVDVHVALRGGASALAAFTAAVDELAADTDGGDFAPAIVTATSDGTAALVRSSRVLLGGFAVAIAVGALAALLGLVQAWGRHHGATAGDQRIERALGLPARERVLARLLPALGVAAVAVVTVAAVTVVAAGLEPSGAIRRVEPHPGWRLDVVTLLAGAVATALAVAGSAAVTAWAAGRPQRDVRRPPVRVLPLAPRRGGWPLLGIVLARSSAGGRTAAPVRTAVVAAVLGVAGVVGAMTFVASLDRLTSTPARYGWTADLGVADVDDRVVAELAADPRLGAVVDVAARDVDVGGRTVTGYAYTPVRGDVGWTLLDGRIPQAAGEVVLGGRLAGELGAAVGDTVVLGDGATARPVGVVGIGVGPVLTGEVLGDHVLATLDDLDAASTVGAFREAVATAAPGVGDIVVDDLAGRYEVMIRQLPVEVRNLADLGSLPAVLGGFLAALALLALFHALAVTVRQRAADLAVLGALGATRRQVRAAVVTTAVATALVGIVLGVPLGWAVARFVWGSLARSIGVAADVATPVGILVVPVVAVAAAVLLALVPARWVPGVDAVERAAHDES